MDLFDDPFPMTLPGFTVTEIDPVEDNGERWFGLQAHFPDRLASHSRLQEFYFDSDFLLRRHDYRVDVATDELMVSIGVSGIRLT